MAAPDKKEEALEDVLKALRISLNYISLYSKEHRSFIKSAGELKKNLDRLFNFLNPVVIGFTPDSLFVDGNAYKKTALHKELARIFHLRKIKSIQISQGTSAEELMSFLDKVSLPPKEILKSGGVNNLLDQTEMPHLSVEDLDYSQLLKDEGEELKDVWSYLLKKALDQENLKKIDEFADNFQANIRRFKPRDLLENPELSQNLTNFFSYLKDNNQEKFRSCATAMFKFVIQDKSMPAEEQLNKIAVFFKDLNENDLADTLWEELSTDDRFDSYSFQLFSRLIEKEKHEKIVSSLTKSAQKNKSAANAPLLNRKIKELFSLSEDSFISTIYRRVLTSLAEEASFEAELSFDRRLLEESYRLILLNLLATEKNQQRMGLITQRLLEKWDEIIAERNLDYLKNLRETLNRRKQEQPSLAGLGELDIRFSNFIEGLVWEDNLPEEFDYFIDSLKSSALGAEGYLRKICEENKVTGRALKLLFKLFPEAKQNFYDSLARKHSDFEWLAEIFQAVKALDPGLAVEILRYIFSISNDLVKIEALEAMADLGEYDKEFLFAILKEASGFLKKGALQILMKNEADKKNALELLFSFPNPWGRKNIILLENIAVVEELDLRAAKQYLSALSTRPFFWNKSVRKKAQEVMERWNVR